MSFGSALQRLCILVVSLFVGVLTTAEVRAQGVLRVYGSEGPSPAIHNAAEVFAARNNIRVDVVSGPTEIWLETAKNDAHVIFSSAAFMMSDFIRTGELEIDRGTVTPLYMRPSAILVRPGNPKAIRDFPDLLRDGVRVMVVTGSGQTGLWEDMAGKQGDVRTIRAFRKNIVFFSPNSYTAMKTWRERTDIDAWVTWSVWHLPLHDHADLISVSEDFVIYRECNAALTTRGKDHAFAAKFLEFLTSAEGANIFLSWDWMSPALGSTPLTLRRDVAVVCQIESDECDAGVGRGLIRLRGLMDSYKAAGVPLVEVHVSAVFQGPAATLMLKDEAYRTVVGKAEENPNETLIQELIETGISIEVCGKMLQQLDLKEKDVLPGVKVVEDARLRIVDLQLQGYAYLRF